MGTFLTVFISIRLAGATLKNALIEQKTENTLKRIDTLPDILMNFIESNTELIVCWIEEQNNAGNQNNQNKIRRKKASEKYDASLKDLEKILLMYGSKEAVKLLHELVTLMRSIVNDRKTLALSYLYSLLVLLCAQIRHDLTGVDIDFIYYYDLLVPQMTDGEKGVYNFAQQYIEKFNLPLKI